MLLYLVLLYLVAVSWRNREGVDLEERGGGGKLGGVGEGELWLG